MAQEALSAIMAEEGLPATTPRFQYQGVGQCIRSFELEAERHDKEGNPGGYVVVYNVDERSFLGCFAGERELTHPWKSYNFTNHTVILKMSSKIHAVAVPAFAFLVDAWSRQAQTTLLPTLDAKVAGLTRTKAPDASWTPAALPGEEDRHWPTVILELGWTETRTKLNRDMLFWLQESNGQVKVALTMKVDGITIDNNGVQHEACITIEQWSYRETRDASLRRVQTMKIVRDVSGSHQISGSLSIRFKDVFLRGKRGSETDFRMSHDDMKKIGELVWNQQLPGTMAPSAAGPSAAGPSVLPSEQ